MRKFNQPVLDAWSRRLFFVNAALWLCLGSLSLQRALQGEGANRGLYSVLMLGNSALMLAFGRQLPAAGKRIHQLATCFIFLNILLLAFDQFGLVDLMVALPLVILLTVLLLNRGRKLPERVG